MMGHASENVGRWLRCMRRLCILGLFDEGKAVLSTGIRDFVALPQ